MTPLEFCAVVNVAQAATCAFLGWCILQGATPYLILVMVLLALNTITPKEKRDE